MTNRAYMPATHVWGACKGVMVILHSAPKIILLSLVKKLPTMHILPTGLLKGYFRALADYSNVEY